MYLERQRRREQEEKLAAMKAKAERLAAARESLENPPARDPVEEGIFNAQAFQEHPDQRVRCLAFAAEQRYREGKLSEGDHLIECAVGHFWRA